MIGVRRVRQLDVQRERRIEVGGGFRQPGNSRVALLRELQKFAFRHDSTSTAGLTYETACGLRGTRRRAARGARVISGARGASSASGEMRGGFACPATISRQLLPHRADGGGVVLRAEDSGAGDKGVGASARHLGDVVDLDAAVYLQPDLLAGVARYGVDAPAHLCNLRKDRPDELLSAESRVHGHEQHEVQLLEG